MAHMGHPYEWQNSSNSMMGTAATEQQKAAEANRMSGSDIRSTSALSMNAGNSSNDALANWTATNDTLTNKMEAERAAVVQEIADLTAERAAAQLFDAAFRPGLAACEKCHAIRAQRPKRELILDTAAIALRDQHTDCHQSLELLAQVDAACGGELDRLDVTLQELSKAIDLKRAHLEVDDACITGAVPAGQAPPPLSQSSLLPYRWKQDAEESVTKSMNVRAVAERVRAKSAKVQSDVSRKQTEFRDLVVRTLSKKLGDTTGLCNDLKARLATTHAEIAAVGSSLNETSMALDDKEAPLGLAEGRLTARLNRPATERVRDEVERALEKEVHELATSMAKLNADISRGASHLQRLQRVQAELQADVMDKEATITLDSGALGEQKAIAIA